jgi:membrane-associated phospholipid phosphatase
MPSGDTACGTVFLALTGLTFNFWFMFCLPPIVAFSRVYFHCHWVLDTCVGLLIGSAFAWTSFQMLPNYAEMYISVMV